MPANIYYDYRAVIILPYQSILRFCHADAEPVRTWSQFAGSSVAKWLFRFSPPPLIHGLTRRLISSIGGDCIRITASPRFPHPHGPTLSRRVLPAVIMYPSPPVVRTDNGSIAVAMRKSRMRIIAYVVRPIATPLPSLLMSINLHIGGVREPRRTAVRGPNGNPRQKRYN